jgi:hypothetical protein
MGTEMDSLGFIVGREGLRMAPTKITVIEDWPKPESVTEVRGFLGLVQLFRRFISRFSEIAAPLTNLTKKNNSVSHWDSSCDKAFVTLKEAVKSAPVLQSPNWKKPFRCHVDASQLAVGGTLTQKDERGFDHPIAFYSKKLSPAEANYSTNDRELLGLISFLQRFRGYLEESEFEVFTDNQVLKHLFPKATVSRKEARWLETLGNFGIFSINLKPGKVHVLRDVLSRAPHTISSEDISSAVINGVEIPVVDFSDFSGNYEHDQFLGPILQALQGVLPADDISRRQVNRLLPMFTADEGLLRYENKLCVPRRCVSRLLQMAHDSRIGGHFGHAKTISRLANFYWRHKSRDVKLYVHGCLKCQQCKDLRQKPLTEPTPLELPERRWGSIATDLITHLPVTKAGYDSITTWVDRLSRRVHFVPSKSKDTAVDCAKNFFRDVFKNHGLPDNIVSDRDSKFTSMFWKTLMELCGITLKMSTSRHPQTDGSSEIMNRMIEN